MNFAPAFKGMRFAVLGLGKAGLPAAKALRGMGAEVFVWDDAAASREAAAEFDGDAALRGAGAVGRAGALAGHSACAAETAS